MSLVFMAVDPSLPPILDLEFQRLVLFPILNTIALIASAGGIVAYWVVYKQWRLEGLFALISIAIAFFAYVLFWTGVFDMESRSALVRAVIPVFYLAPGIPSIIGVYVKVKSRWKTKL